MILATLAEATSDSSNITRVFMGLAALLGAYTAYKVRRNDANADAVVRLKNRNEDLEADVITLTRAFFDARVTMSSNGLTPPEVPTLKSGRET